MDDYKEDRNELRKFVGKNITIVGTLEGERLSNTKNSHKEIKRYLLRRVEVKGQNIKLDHIWIPGDIVHNRLNEMVFGNVFEVTGEVQHYARVNKVEGLSIAVIKENYKIDKLKKVTLIKGKVCLNGGLIDVEEFQKIKNSKR